MKEYNSFWPVYKNLEDETLQLAKYINFSDDQLKVYSMYIANLIIRVVIEIESLSKELYKINGGPEVMDENNKPRDLYFDTDCIEYLNNIWGICNREIMVSCINFNFIKEENIILKPLKRANKMGTSSSKWNKAYQAVKHDRKNSIKEGNIENLIKGLGALYILNLYYKDETLNYKFNNENFFDNRLGSDIFAVSCADASKASIGIDHGDTSINKEEREKLDTCVYVIKYTDTSWEEMHKELIDYNQSIITEITKKPEFQKKLSKKITNSSTTIEKAVKELISEMQNEYIKHNPPIKLGRMISNGKKEVVLNKRQVIYK